MTETPTLTAQELGDMGDLVLYNPRFDIQYPVLTQKTFAAARKGVEAAEKEGIEKFKKRQVRLRLEPLLKAVENKEPWRMQLCCIDCGRAYGNEFGFSDLVVPNDVWAKISPTG